MKIKILKPENVNSIIEKQFSELYRQLSPYKKIEHLRKILDEKKPISIVYCENNEKIIGIAAMCNFHVISGNKGWIEDVIVDTEMRGKGVGQRLVDKFLEVAKQKELSEVLLFTANHQFAAISLYKKLGFNQKDSQIYQLNFK